MADPALQLIKMQATERRMWIGPLDGLLKGFGINRGSSDEQLEIATMQIVEFFFQQCRVGLQNLNNRMTQVPLVENTDITEDNASQWKKGGTVYKLLRGCIQEWRKKIKAHRKLHSNMGKFVWPSIPVQTEDILNDLLEFSTIVLQYSAVDEWSIVDAGNATYVDDKFTSGIIDAFWKGRGTHRAWLAEKAAWNCRKYFGDILSQAAGTTFEYPDGQQKIDTHNPFAVLPDDGQQDDDDEDENIGFFGSFNKHIVHRDLFNMRQRQTQSVEKIIKLVLANGVIGQDGDTMLPNKVYKGLKSFLEVRKCQLVGFYVLH